MLVGGPGTALVGFGRLNDVSPGGRMPGQPA